ncbi:MAG: FAD-dependent oxidoreductase [Haloarculaceae archaeon]
MTAAMDYDVIIVGGGVAGTSAGIFTARGGLETAVLSAGGSLLRRNAHLENYPGFPAGVDARRLLGMMRDQAERNGCTFHETRVTRVDRTEEGFRVEATDGTRSADYVVAATKNAADYLEGLDGLELVDRGKTFVSTDRSGRTGVPGLYAAGRLAEKPHQAIVAAGHGAEVAVALLEDDDRPFYHDWVTPEGYFTGRGRQVPPGCEEIDEVEHRRRERAAMDVTRSYFDEPHPETPEQHPSVEEGDRIGPS